MLSCYRLQHSCSKVIFSQASVSHSVHGGGVSQHALGKTLPDPPGTQPWADTPPPVQYMLGYTHTRGHCCWRYASYWNAYLLAMYFNPVFNTMLSTFKSCLAIYFRRDVFWGGYGRNGPCFGQFVRKTLPSRRLHKKNQTKELSRKYCWDLFRLLLSSCVQNPQRLTMS